MLGIPGTIIVFTFLYKYTLSSFPLFWFPEKYQFKAEPDYATESIVISRRKVPNKLTEY
jgi:hypothetical protein